MSAEPAFSFALKYNNSVSFKNFQVGGVKINGDLATNGKEIAVLTTVKIGRIARSIGGSAEYIAPRWASVILPYILCIGGSEDQWPHVCIDLHARGD